MAPVTLSTIFTTKDDMGLPGIVEADKEKVLTMKNRPAVSLFAQSTKDGNPLKRAARSDENISSERTALIFRNFKIF